MFIVFRYKKLGAALGMKSTNPIKRKQINKRKDLSLSSALTETILGPTPFAHYPFWGINYQENYNAKVHLRYAFFARKSKFRKYKTASAREGNNSRRNLV